MADEHWHALELGEVARELGADPDKGLSSPEAKARLEQHGPNEFAKEERASPWAMFLGQFKNILIIILLVAIALSVVVGEVTDAIIIAVIVLFSAVLGFVQEFRAEKALEALKRMLSPTITALRDGRPVEIESREIVPGDIMLLEAGDRIPADGRLLEAHSVKCDEASLTGESIPVGKQPVPLPEATRLADRANMVYAGTVMTYGRGKGLVTATAMGTELGRIAKEVAAVKKEPTPLERRTEEIGKWLGTGALTICGLVAGFSIVREAMHSRLTMDFTIDAIMFAVALAVAAVPEALAAIVTGALAIGMHRMAKQGAVVRKMAAVETLGSTTVICSDKTGTLTRGEMTVRRLWSGGRTVGVTGAGYAPDGAIEAPVDEPLRMLLLCGLLCNDSRLDAAEGQFRIIGDPTEGALVTAAAKAGLGQEALAGSHPRLGELPFSSERKRMSTLHAFENSGPMAMVKGAPEVVLDRCRRILDASGIRDLTESDRQSILDANAAMAKDALRVLAAAMRELPPGTGEDEEAVETDLVFLGLFGMMDPPRPEVIASVQTAKRVGIKTVMITGDHKLTAMAVAREIGIYAEKDTVLTGEELEAMSDEAFAAIVHTVTVYARVSPIDKLRIVKAWKSRGEVVAMTGDGVNDAPALKYADIGVAMGVTGTDVSKEAADMVLTDDNFATIIKAIELGRWIYDNIKKYLTYLLRCNITEVIVIGGVVLVMGPEYLPLLPAAILYINLATDGLPALALGVAPPDKDIMERPPRNPKESVFSREVLAFISLAVLVEIPFFLYLFFQGFDSLTEARTEMFFLFIIVEIVIALNFRSMRYSIFKAPPHKWLLLATAWEIALVVVVIQFPTMREAFGIEMPTWKGLSIIFCFSLFVVGLMELLKAWLRSRGSKALAA